MESTVVNTPEKENPLTLISIIKSIKSFILLISRIAFIIASFYYIINYKSYSITINIPAGWRIGVIQTFCNSIESIGLMLMIIPLTLVIMSFFYNQSKILNLLSNFLSFSGNIFTFALMASSGLLEERFKAGIFTVYHAINYQKKQFAFKHLFDEKVMSYSQQVVDKSDYQTFIQQAVDKSWVFYLDKVKLLSMDSLDAYATKIVASLHSAYIDQLINTNSNKPSSIWASFYNTIITHKILTSIALLAGTYAIYWAINRFRTLGLIVTDSAHNQITITETQSRTIETQKVTDNALSSIAEQQTIMSTTIEQNTHDIQELQERTNKLSNAVNQNADILQNIVSHKDTSIADVARSSRMSDTKILDLINKTNEIVSESQHNIQDLNTKVNNVKHRVDTLESTKSSNNNSVNVSSPTADSAERREVINLQTLANDTKADLLKLRKETKTNHQSLSTKIEDLGKESETNTEAIGNVRKEFTRQGNANKMTHDELIKRQEALSHNQENMTETLIQSVDNIKVLDTTLKKHEDTLIAQETNSNTKFKDQESFLLSNVEKMDSTVKALENKVTTLQENVETLKENHQVLRNEVMTSLQSLTSQFGEFKTSITQKLSALHPGRGIIHNSFSMLQGIRADNQRINQEGSSTLPTTSTPTMTTTSTSSNININEDSNIAPNTLDFTKFSHLRDLAIGTTTLSNNNNNNNVTTPINTSSNNVTIPRSVSSSSLSSNESSLGSDVERDSDSDTDLVRRIILSLK